MTDKEPKLEILFDPADANTHQPAHTSHNVGIVVEENGGAVGKQIDVLRKYLKVVVHNTGEYVAKSCIAKARVLIPDKDKDNDNQLRYPSTEQKLLVWDVMDGEVSPITSINVDESERLYVAFADSDYSACPIQEAPKRHASLATKSAIMKLGRNGLRVENSFFTGDFDIEVTVSSELTSVKKYVRIHVDAEPINTAILGVSDAPWSSDHSVGNQPAST